MSSYGVLPEGFRQKTLDVILTELEAAEQLAFGATINTQADSVLGQLNRIFADQIAQAWEVALGVYRSLYPDSAGGDALDNVAAITGALRLGAAPSSVSLELNVGAGVTLLAGRQVQIGSDGELWQTTEDATNADTVQATLAVPATSINSGPIVGNQGTINRINTPVSGWVARAALDQATGEPFVLANSQTLLVAVDGETPQTVTFVTGDFVNITAATADEVATKINSATDGITATAQNGSVRLQSDTDGPGSSIQVTGGTANAELGFAYELREGFNPDRSAKRTSGAAEPYALSNSMTLVVQIDGGGAQTVTFLTGDFVSIGMATAREIAAKLTSALTGAKAYNADGRVRIETLVEGPNGSVLITGGSAQTELDFVETLISGTTGAAVVGRSIELDPDFRIRREELLRIAGAATVEAIRAAVRAVDGVVQAFVFENPSDVVDGNGLEPHSFEAVVSGGDDQTIGDEIFAVKPAGIATHRDPGGAGVTVTVTDSQGSTHDINFTRPTDVDMYIEVTVEVNDTVFGGGDQDAGIEQVKEALKALGDTLNIGDDVIIKHFEAVLFGVTGVLDVPSIAIEDTTPPLNTANFVIASRELAVFSTARIVVNVT